MGLSPFLSILPKYIQIERYYQFPLSLVWHIALSDFCG